MASITIRSLMMRCLRTVTHSTLLQIMVIKPCVETMPRTGNRLYILKGVIPKVLGMISHITIYNPQWELTFGAELVSPMPVINSLIGLHIIVPLTLSRVLYGLSVCGCTISSICIPTIHLLVDGICIVVASYYRIICTNGLSVLMLSVLVHSKLMVVFSTCCIGRKSHT